jgi:DNA mismatch endonuclease Vsr
MLVRQGLRARGLRYRLHDRKLPGRPDLFFSQYQAAVFVHGCFWHAHGYALSKLPAMRQDFRKNKLEGNPARDRRTIDALLAAGWRVLVIWECALSEAREIDRGGAARPRATVHQWAGAGPSEAGADVAGHRQRPASKDRIFPARACKRNVKDETGADLPKDSVGAQRGETGCNDRDRDNGATH